jgi:hypothetical protein
MCDTFVVTRDGRRLDARTDLRALGAALGLLLAPSLARAHDGDHGRMPHMVTAGVIPLQVARMLGAEPRIEGRSVAAVGGAASYAYAPVREIELRARFAYVKPLPPSEALRDGLHQFRVTVGPVLVAELLPDDLDLVTSVELGAAIHHFDAANAVGPTAWASLGLRGWVSWHTGFWGELRTGLSDTSGAPGGFTLWSAAPLELMLGWADRF